MDIILTDERYKGLHIPKIITNEDKDQLIKFAKCSVFDYITFLRRIGSDSLRATVWLVSLESKTISVTFAIKVQEDVEKSEREIENNKVLMKYPDHFLQMYYDVNCDHIVMNGKIFGGIFMFMEVAIGDLAQVLHVSNVTKKELFGYILDVFESVRVMAIAQLFHADLHIRNVFIVYRNGKQKAVIGDFGESFFISSPTSHLSDASRFMASLMEELKGTKYFTVKERIQNAFKFINIQSHKSEKEFDVKFNEISEDISDNEFFYKQDDILAEIINRDIDNIIEFFS